MAEHVSRAYTAWPCAYPHFQKYNISKDPLNVPQTKATGENDIVIITDIFVSWYLRTFVRTIWHDFVTFVLYLIVLLLMLLLLMMSRKHGFLVRSNLIRK